MGCTNHCRSAEVEMAVTVGMKLLLDSVLNSCKDGKNKKGQQLQREGKSPIYTPFILIPPHIHPIQIPPYTPPPPPHSSEAPPLLHLIHLSPQARCVAGLITPGSRRTQDRERDKNSSNVTGDAGGALESPE